MRSEGDYKYFDDKAVKYDITSINQVFLYEEKLIYLFIYYYSRLYIVVYLYLLTYCETKALPKALCSRV